MPQWRSGDDLKEFKSTRFGEAMRNIFGCDDRECSKLPREQYMLLESLVNEVWWASRAALVDGISEQIAKMLVGSQSSD